MSITIPSRDREIEVGGQQLWLRRPDRPELGPVIDAQVSSVDDRDADARQVLERGSLESVVAASVMVCLRSDAGADGSPEIGLPDARAIVVEAAAAESVQVHQTALARQAMALCRVPIPR